MHPSRVLVRKSTRCFGSSWYHLGLVVEYVVGSVKVSCNTKFLNHEIYRKDSGDQIAFEILKMKFSRKNTSDSSSSDISSSFEIISRNSSSLPERDGILRRFSSDSLLPSSVVEVQPKLLISSLSLSNSSSRKSNSVNTLRSCKLIVDKNRYKLNQTVQTVSTK